MAGTPIENSPQELLARTTKFSSQFVRSHLPLEGRLLLLVDEVQLAVDPSVAADVTAARAVTYTMSQHGVL